MAWKGGRKDGDLVNYAKSSVSTLGRVTYGKAPSDSYSSGKGILKTKTDGQTPKKQIDGNMNTKYSQKDDTSSNVERG